MKTATPSTIWVPKLTSKSWIPEGYILMTGPDNEQYIAPEFMVPVLEQDYNAKGKKKELRASGAPGTVSHLFLLGRFWYRRVFFKMPVAGSALSGLRGLSFY
jgi:hypothetical protein